MFYFCLEENHFELRMLFVFALICKWDVSQVLERQKLLEAADGMAVAVGVGMGGLQGSNRQTDQKVSDQFLSKYMSLNTFCE